MSNTSSAGWRAVEDAGSSSTGRPGNRTSMRRQAGALGFAAGAFAAREVRTVAFAFATSSRAARALRARTGLSDNARSGVRQWRGETDREEENGGSKPKHYRPLPHGRGRVRPLTGIIARNSRCRKSSIAVPRANRTPAAPPIFLFVPRDRRAAPPANKSMTILMKSARNRNRAAGAKALDKRRRPSYKPPSAARRALRRPGSSVGRACD